MFDPVSAPIMIRIICSAYLLSACVLLSFTTFGWWIISSIEHQGRHHPKWFS